MSQLLADFPRFSTGSPPCHQNFSLPSFMISHIVLNPTSPEVYQKLTQTCKYFYSKNPIIIVDNLDIYDQNCSIDYYPVETKLFKDVPYKFWLKEDTSLWYSNLDPENFNILISKIFRVNFNHLYILNGNLKYSDLELLTSKGTFHNFSIQQSDIVHDSPIDISDVFKLFVDATYLDLECSPTLSFTSETIKKLMDIPAFPNLKEFLLRDIPEVLDIDEFLKFMQKHLKVSAFLYFSDDISENYRKYIMDAREICSKTNMYIRF